MINVEKEKETATALMEAIESKDKTQIKEAWKNFQESIVEKVKSDIKSDRPQIAVCLSLGYLKY